MRFSIVRYKYYKCDEGPLKPFIFPSFCLSFDFFFQKFCSLPNRKIGFIFSFKFFRELLRGPLYYVIVLLSSVLVFWRDSPVGIISLAMMSGGDGKYLVSFYLNLPAGMNQFNPNLYFSIQGML